MFNELVDASIPVSVFNFPAYFQYPDIFGLTFAKSTSNDLILNAFSMIDVPWKIKIKYHYIWHAYYQDKTNFTMYCMKHGNNCSSLEGFKLLDEKGRDIKSYDLTHNFYHRSSGFSAHDFLRKES